jgi:hypothetical protein
MTTQSKTEEILYHPVHCGFFGAILHKRRHYVIVKLIFEPGMILKEKKIVSTPFRGDRFPANNQNIKKSDYYEIHRIPRLPGKHKELREVAHPQ